MLIERLAAPIETGVDGGRGEQPSRSAVERGVERVVQRSRLESRAHRDGAQTSRLRSLRLGIDCEDRAVHRTHRLPALVVVAHSVPKGRGISRPRS